MKSASKKVAKVKSENLVDPGRLVVPGKEITVSFGKDVKFEPFKIPKGESKTFRLLPFPKEEDKLAEEQRSSYVTVTIPAFSTNIAFPKLDIVGEALKPYSPPEPALRMVENQYAIRAPGHYHEVFTNIKERVAAVIKVIREQCGQVDAIAVCGISGMSLVGAISHETGIPMTVVRKRNEDLCHGFKVTGWLGSGRYVILDDLISSGQTVNHIHDTIAEEAKKNNQAPPTLGGIVLHHLRYGGNYCMNNGLSVPTYYAKRDYPLPS